MKKIAKIIIFCIIFVFMFNYVYRVLAWKDTAGEYYSSMDSFYELEQDTVDVLFLGSSHCYCSINNALLWDNYGISSFSLAISGQDLASSYYCFKEALKTQSPKVVCVELYGALFDGYAVQGNLYRNTLPFQMSFTSYNAVADIAGEEDVMDYWLKWPIIHTRYAELQKEDFDADGPVYLGYHAEYHTQTIPELVPYTGEEVTPIGESLEEWIYKMIELAQAEEIELCFFVAPSSASQEEQKKYKYVEQMVEEKGIPCIDMIALKDTLGLDEAQDFIDGAHTNYFGAQKVTSYMGDFLWSNYALTDHYGDERYQVWDENSQVREHEMNNYTLQCTTDLAGYLGILGYLQDYTIIIGTTGNYLYQEAPILEPLTGIGIYDEFYQTGGVWVIEDAEVIFRNTSASFGCNIDLGECDLAINSTDGTRSMVVEFVEQQKAANGINIIVYDKVLGEVVDSVGFTSEQEYACVR